MFVCVCVCVSSSQKWLSLFSAAIWMFCTQESRVLVSYELSSPWNLWINALLAYKLYFSLLQQRKLAEYCTEIFGDMLLYQPLESWPVRSVTFLSFTVEVICHTLFNLFLAFLYQWICSYFLLLGCYFVVWISLLCTIWYRNVWFLTES